MGFGGILVIFRFRGVFWSFVGFWGYFGLFLWGILVSFRFWGYFGHFTGFGGILVIFWILVVFWSFFKFQGYFGYFLEI